MVDSLGHWTWTPEMSHQDFCTMDYVMEAIENHGGYTPQHMSMEDLIDIVLDFYDGEIADGNGRYFAISEPNHDCPHMVNGEDVWEYIQASGGLKEFDHEY